MFIGATMTFDSLFDDAMKLADEAIERTMTSEFRLQLRDGSHLNVSAVFDAKLEPASGRTNRSMFIAEEGALTVLNRRIDKALVEGACVQTELGERHIADVFYPEANTSVLVLSTRGRGRHDGNFLK